MKLPPSLGTTGLVGWKDNPNAQPPTKWANRLEGQSKVSLRSQGLNKMKTVAKVRSAPH